MVFILNDQNNESQVFFSLLDFCRKVRTLSDQTIQLSHLGKMYQLAPQCQSNGTY